MTLILSIITGKSMQDIFALLNAQSILTHMMLLACSATAPSNISGYNEKLSNFA